MEATPSEFTSKKTLASFRHLADPDCILLCEECEQNKANVCCLSCEQNQCANCDLAIHNKGRRAQHDKKPIKIQSKRFLKVIFVSFESLKEALGFSVTDQDIGIKFIDFISSILEKNNISDEESVIYIYYSSDAQISEELLSKLCIQIEALRYCFFMDVDRVHRLDEVQNVQFNKEIILVNDQKVLALARCLSTLSKGYQHVYIYDHKNATELGFLVLAAENSEAHENHKIFVSEHKQASQILKMEELTPKKSMQLMNMSKQIERKTAEYQTESGKGKFTNEGFSSELYGKSGTTQGGFLFDKRPRNQSQSFNENVTGSPSFSNAFDPERRNEYSGLSLNDSNEKNRFNLADFSEQFYQKPTTAQKISNFSQEQFPSLQSSGQQFKPSSNPKQGRSPFLMVGQPLKELEVDGSIELGRFIQRVLYKLALQGELILLKERFAEMIDEAVTKKFNKKTFTVIDKATQVAIIHSTVRTFADGETVTYISLQLDIITIESLGWICRSIKRDAMAPTEKLVLSRIKECFALKLGVDEWKIILNSLLDYQNSNKKLPIGDSEGILAFSITHIADPSTGVDTHVVGIKGEEWSFDDIGTVDETSASWKSFMKFLDDFFDEEEEEDADKSKQPKKESNPSSLHQKHPHYEDKYGSHYRSEKASNQLPEGRAIPGGRYGCAQFLKACGPETLRNETLGRLNLYVQEAINRGILRYQRTLLVKNTQAGILEGKLDNSEENNALLAKQLQQLNKIKGALIEVLAENPSGLSLAQIPQYLRRKLSFSFNLQDMGFPKLKNLLTTMTDDIKIELSGTNHSYASLKNPDKYAHLARRRGSRNYYSHVNEEDSGILFGYSVSGSFPHHSNFQESEVGTTHVHTPTTQSKLYVKKYNTFTPEAHTSKSTKFEYRKKSNSSFEEYLQKVRASIERIAQKCRSGLEIEQFYVYLTKDLGNSFDVTLFDCRDFYEFLRNQAEGIVEVHISKDPETHKSSCIVFPKSFRFMPTYPVQEPNQERYFFQQQQQQTTPMKDSKPPLYSGTSSYFYGSANYQNQNSPDYKVGGAISPMLFNPQSPLFQINPSVSNSKPIENKERQYFSPVIQADESPTRNRNESYLRSNFGVFGSLLTGMETPQADPRNLRQQEESFPEVDDNFKFIDNLLKDNSNPKNKTGPQEISLNVSNTWDKSYSYDKAAQNKASNNEFYSGNQPAGRYPPGLKVQGRGNNDYYQESPSGRFIGSQNSM